MTLIEKFKRWQRRKYCPRVEISRSGWLTDRPQVHVSVQGFTGTQGVYTFDDTNQGNACAEMYGKGLAEKIERPLFDLRRKGEEGKRG